MIARACDVRAPLLKTPDALLEPAARMIEAARKLGMQTPADANQVRLGDSFAWFDGGKAARELYQPQVDIETSLRATYEWYSEHGYIYRDWLSRLIGVF